MNILFLTLLKIRDIDAQGIYEDLMREFAQNNHDVYIISPSEKRDGESTMMLESDIADWHKRVHILQLRTGNITGTCGLIEKGISTLRIEQQITRGIKKYFSDVRFDLVLYSTPPITLVKPVQFIKKRDGAKAYLMLKDIFPQNAVDIGMMSVNGVKGLLYRYFRYKEQKLYCVSDKIGCMSPANVKYVLEHNPQIAPDKVEICPNSIAVKDLGITDDERFRIREKYQIPQNTCVFVYGGNLGKPQGIDFLIDCLKSQINRDAVYFLIVGSGTEYERIKQFTDDYSPNNIKLLNRVPVEDYNVLLSACDVGMIFLDYRFTIPNYPSRLLGYMQAKLPIIVCSDPNTDIGKIAQDNGFGLWCESNHVTQFIESIALLSDKQIREEKGEAGYQYLKDNYSVNKVVKQIIKER